MKKLLLVGLAVAALASPAFSAGMPSPASAAPGTWTGCYVGGNLGGGWVHSSFFDVEATSDFGSHTAAGAIGGVQAGCDYQNGAWVFGIRGLLDASGLSGSNTSPVAPSVVSTGRYPGFAALTGRIGYAVQPSTLIYVAAGVAWLRSTVTASNGLGSAATFTRQGPLVGAGVEHRFTPKWSVFGEYDHMDFGTRNVTMIGGGFFTNRIAQSADALMVGVNYRFK
jgi:outer membrane immunogenic protein